MQFLYFALLQDVYCSEDMWFDKVLRVRKRLIKTLGEISPSDMCAWQNLSMKQNEFAQLVGEEVDGEFESS